MPSEHPKVELLQGTLDLIILRALSTMGRQHAYGLAARLEQVAEHLLMLNQGTLYPARMPRNFPVLPIYECALGHAWQRP